MQKYWKTISMMIVMVLGIGTFYIHKAVTASQYPDFIIETVSGDEAEIDNIVLQGSYKRDTIEEMVYITPDGSKYLSEYPYWKQLDMERGLPLFQRLESEYRGFMREKTEFLNFYEDDTYLIYADMSSAHRSVEPTDFTLVIDVLDKETDEETSFDYHLSAVEDDIHFIMVEDVQRIDDNLKIMTSNVHDNGDQSIRVYTFDMDAETLLDDETVITATEPDENHSIDFVKLPGPDDYQPEEYAVISQVETEYVEMDDGMYMDEKLSRELFAYDFATGEVETFDPSEEWGKQPDVDLFDGSRLYVTEMEDHTLHVSIYNIADAATADAFKVDLPKGALNDSVADDSERMGVHDAMDDSVADDIAADDGMDDEAQKPNMTISHNRLLIYTPTVKPEQPASLFVVDTDTGDIVYEGNIVEKDSANDEDYTLSLHNLTLVQ